ncbi:protein-tyrosine phosphatase [Sphingobium faniae]|nr:protein-tyrosine phosphatase [Sphingobium faniae]
MKQILSYALPLLLAAAPAAVQAKAPADPQVTRTAPDRLDIRWTDAGGVDVYMADHPDVPAEQAKLISANDRDGSHEVAVAAGKRPYFLLRDRKDGASVRVAERLLPLEQGSNFRDVGGYPAADGKHVRWGMIFRSGGTPLLNEADMKTVGNLHLANMVDLRSSEERQLAPSKVYGVPYHAIGYSMAAITSAMQAQSGTDAKAALTNGGKLYARMPQMLAPQMRLLFDRLLSKQGPVAYNCSAGQDRTGFATALILSALGVPRDVILADYHLSTQYRRPEFEMAKFDPAAFPDNAAAQMFSQYRRDPAAAKPQPLKEADGKAFLSFALEEIDQRYGSVENYLDKELGVTKLDIAALRATYLE